ncbi:MAG: 6-carboxytetrahydropterin synthase [Theionarchaea archaeon]|nr:6-carboxytetrahydropterin synthase [Theionarchaea archaeon]
MSRAVYRVEASFSASHCMPDHSRCSTLHGHNYTVEVFLRTELSASDHLQVDLSALKHTLREVLEGYDHTHLNDKIPYPSCENIALSILEELKARGVTPYSVRIWETPLQWVEVIPGE